ncbi:MAG: hypothetical protein ICV65_06865, partial [Flavisolibacter sp.]|nr:hypothetical protein [Flavisolibacter sp.]
MATFKIFLASSSELKEDRIEFRLFISEKDKDWKHKDVRLETVVWEEFLDAVSTTRSQDEYNKAIEECDIFVLLFFTKVGQYTEEEFEKAYNHFKATGKPRLFIYFKNADIKAANLNEEDVVSFFKFKKKLKELEHFYVVYETIGDLKYDFSSQLDKLAAEGFFGTIKPTGSGKTITGGATSPKELTLTLPKTDPRDIIGREKDLKELHDLLTTDQRVVVVN